MKAKVVLFIAILLSSTLGGTKVNGQAVAIGHVFAEVVESVSVASATISDFELAKSTQDLSANLVSETLNLGSIILNSGKDITCNVVLQSANLSDAQGNGFTIEPAIQNPLVASTVKSNGSHTIQLGGTTIRTGDQASGLYGGSYTVIFAYN